MLPASMWCSTSDLLGFAQSGLEHLRIIWGNFSGSLGSVCLPLPESVSPLRAVKLGMTDLCIRWLRGHVILERDLLESLNEWMWFMCPDGKITLYNLPCKREGNKTF